MFVTNKAELNLYCICNLTLTYYSKKSTNKTKKITNQKRCQTVLNAEKANIAIQVLPEKVKKYISYNDIFDSEDSQEKGKNILFFR